MMQLDDETDAKYKPYEGLEGQGRVHGQKQQDTTELLQIDTEDRNTD